MTRQSTQLIAGLLSAAFAVLASAAQGPPVETPMTGMFTSMTSSTASGDVTGMELFVVSGATGYFGIVQGSEGAPGDPLTVPLQVRGVTLRFSIPSRCACALPEGSYEAEISHWGARLRGPANFGERHLPRSDSYWQRTTSTGAADATVGNVLERHFGKVTLAGGTSPAFPRFLVSDMNADGKPDLVAAFSDAETARRGEDCFGLGIVHSYQDAPSEHYARRFYNCFKAYSVESVKPFSIRGPGADILGTSNISPAGPCVQIVLTHDYRNAFCWVAMPSGVDPSQKDEYYWTLDSRNTRIAYR